MKKITAIILTAALLFGLTACGGEKKADYYDNSDNSESSDIPQSAVNGSDRDIQYSDNQDLPLEYDLDGDGTADTAEVKKRFILEDGSFTDDENSEGIVNALPVLAVKFGNGESYIKPLADEAGLLPGQMEAVDLDGDGRHEIVLVLESLGSFRKLPFYALKYDENKKEMTEFFHLGGYGYDFELYFNDDYTFIVSCGETGFASEPFAFNVSAYEIPYIPKDGLIYFASDINAPQNFGVDGIFEFETTESENGVSVELRQYAWAGPHAGNLGYAASVFVFDKEENTLRLDSQRFVPEILPSSEPAQNAEPEPAPSLNKVMYLTFDDGPSPSVTPLVLDILKERGIKATFFVVGAFAEMYPDLVRRIADEGHAIALHSYTHDFHEIYASADAFMADLKKVDDAVFEITGIRSRIIRFPGGSVNNYNKSTYLDVIEAVEAAGYIYFDWNGSLQDAVTNPVPSELLNSAINSAGEQSRVVMLAHDRIPQTAQILNQLIDSFEDYEMKPLTADVAPVQFIS